MALSRILIIGAAGVAVIAAIAVIVALVTRK